MEGGGDEDQEEEEQGEDGQGSAFGIQLGYVVQGFGMTTAEGKEEGDPDYPGYAAGEDA